jgi:hypothetical protein
MSDGKIRMGNIYDLKETEWFYMIVIINGVIFRARGNDLLMNDG